MLDSVNKHPTKREIRKFGFTLIIGLPVVGLIWTGIVWLNSEIINFWIFGCFAAVGLAVGSFSLLSESIGRIAYILWHTLAASIEWVISLISTLVMYYLTLVPIGLIMKLFGRKPLPVQYDKNRKSYWNDHEKEPEMKRYFRQF